MNKQSLQQQSHDSGNGYNDSKLIEASGRNLGCTHRYS